MMPRRLLTLLAGAGTLLPITCAAELAPRAAESERPSLALVDSAEEFGCREVHGELVVLFKPGVGALVLSPAAFPGGQLVGAIEETRARFSFPGLRMPEQVLESRAAYSEPLPLWGMTVRDIDPPDRRGCIGLARPDGLDADQLRTLVRRVAKENPAPP